MTDSTSQPIALRDGTAVQDRRLDRLPYLPDTNRGFTVQRLLAEDPELRAAAKVRRGRGHSTGPGLDQGREGACVLYACTHRRNATPKPLRPAVTDRTAIGGWYHDVQHEDPWNGCALGRNCPRGDRVAGGYEGTSVHSAMDYGKRLGWWKSYWWVGAGSGDVLGDIINANATVGGIVYGLGWFESMFTPRPSGLLEVDLTSGLAGGHALYSPSVRLKMRLKGEWAGTKEVVVFQQSWGNDHGVADLRQPGGMVYMLLEDLGKLMEQRGEGAVVVR